MGKQFLSPKGVYAHPTYSPGVKVSNTVYVSGQVGNDEQGNLVKGGFEAQAQRAFENMARILEEGGASFKDVIKLNGYFTDAADNTANRKKYHEIRSKFFNPPLPIATNVIVCKPGSELLLEVEAVAVID